MEWCTTDDGKYRIESLSRATFSSALKVIKDAFCQDENVSIGSEVNKNPTAAEELLELCADAALDGVSVVAVDIDNGAVAAVTFNKIQVKATAESEKPFFVIFAEERCTQASSRSLVEFMADVDERCNLFEKCVQNKGKYRIESLSRATFSSALKVIKDAFCQDENVSIGSEVNKNPTAAEELLELCADAALDGVSVVAVDIDNGAVAAVTFNKIQVKATAESEKPFFVIFAEERCTQASSRSLVEFMADVDERCNLFEKYKVDCSLEIMFLATLRNYRARGLAKLLTKVSIDIARKIKNGPVAPLHIQDLGSKYSHLAPHKPIVTYPKICQAIWTGERSRCVGKALNFKVHLTVPFTEFRFNGKTYSERIGDESEFCEVAALSL